MNFLSFCIWDYLNFFFFSFITCFSFVFCSIVLTDIEFLNDSLFLSSPWLCYLTAFWPPCFLMRGQLLIHENLLYMRSYFLATFKILSLSLSFESLIMICVGVEPTWNSLSFLDVEINIFYFIYLFFNQSWEVFSHRFFILSALFFLSSPPETAIMSIFVGLMVSQRSLRLCWFFSNFLFLFIAQTGYFLFFSFFVFLSVLFISNWIKCVYFSDRKDMSR